MPRGGRRPGAGAPRGNFNAVRNGRYSPRVRAVLQALFIDPDTRFVLTELGRRGVTTRSDFRETLVAATRLMYDRPLAEEIRFRLRALIDDQIAARERTGLERSLDAIDRAAAEHAPAPRRRTMRPPPARARNRRNAVRGVIDDLNARADRRERARPGFEDDPYAYPDDPRHHNNAGFITLDGRWLPYPKE